MKLTFITGNPHKAAYTSQALGLAIDHIKIDLDEIQALDLQIIVEHKVKQAYQLLKKPVLVEDVALEFYALGRLPGPLIKWFVDEIGNERICQMLGDKHDRAATARICYGLYDGHNLHFFHGSMQGHIAKTPMGDNGFGWDQIFIKEGMDQTRAQLAPADERATSMRRKPLEQLKKFLEH